MKIDLDTKEASLLIFATQEFIALTKKKDQETALAVQGAMGKIKKALIKHSPGR